MNGVDPSAVAAVTALWCTVHSLILTRRVQAWSRRHIGAAHAGSRLAFVVFAVISFAALFWWVHARPSPVLWSWAGWWQIPRAVLVVVGVAVTVLGARVYDQRLFFGLRQIAAQRAGREPPATALVQHGILAHVRHPYYAAAFLLLVGYADFTVRNLAFRTVLALYLVIGTELEERKLLREHGAVYARYRRDVPRFWPRLRPRFRPRS